MKTQLKKWGNSLALRIPKSFADEVGLQNDSAVRVSLYRGKIVISPMEKSKLSLKQLLARVSQDNCHTECDTGASVGKETW